ncbi:glycosyltransferase [Galbitalea soli]|uniref:Glycosyltransferase n=1 Tax=Galbitalea soli TaxID=1268042 RepID=A0A7C9TR24_9MICO|nr:glycosyltransferase [Galbitalea soli]NEM91718.1 glycosyltransferase [Galbitalea soli]NYJ30414.1 GT2 family glycosyltransferase/glycosyltransferase involved in cell wall biosynthesis [Galbitalea soli]
MREPRSGELRRGFRRHESVDPITLVNQLKTAPDLVIVVPVHNGGEIVLDCLRALERHSGRRRIVVIDDHSTDEWTLGMLDGIRSEGRIEVIRNEVNLGYTRTANKATQLDPAADVVLVNSDAIVGPLWVERLRWTAYSMNGVAAVSAFSDYAGGFALPERGIKNDWPEHLGWANVARFIAQESRNWALEAPTAHGFCMYIRRAALDAVGLFDEESFPRGYGEENEWSMRAISAGFTTVGAPHVFVQHAQGASFGDSRTELIANARAIVDELHPSYSPFVGQWFSSKQYATVSADSARMRSILGTDPVRPRTLYVLHDANGGTPETNRDLMNGLAHLQDSFLLMARRNMIRLVHWDNGHAIEIARWMPASPFILTDTWRDDYAALVTEIIVKYAIEVVHVRHLIDQPLTTVPEVCRMLGVPMILSTHDFYYICPSVHLLDQNAHFCGGVCTPGEGPCTLPTEFVRGAPTLKHDWINEWRRRSSTVLDAATRVIATTRSAASIYNANYPRYADKMTLIEHGRDLAGNWSTLRKGRERRPGPVRVACAANWALHKGTEYIARIVAATQGQVEWHILGQGSDFLGEAAVDHGTYHRESFRDVMDTIDPDFMGLFSIWPETYSHTLTEAWALGIPVLATDLGAVADRVRDFGGGILFDVENPESVAAYLLDEAAKLTEGPLDHIDVPRHSIKSRLTMAEDYALLFERVREPITKPVIGYVVKGAGGRHTGSTHVRMIRRVLSAEASSVHFKAINTSDFVSGRDSTEYTSIVIQRDAMDATLVDEFIAVTAARGLPYFVEMDDDLISESSVRRLVKMGYEEAALAALTRLLRSASGLSVSTPELARRLSEFQSKIVIVPNELDDALWTDSRPVSAVEPPKTKAIHVLYMGSVTHTDDLKLLEPVFQRLKASDGRKIVLDLVGVTTDTVEGMNRVAIPAGSTQYPNFVDWLRANGGRWTLGVAPLVEEEFNGAKSDLKFLEYTAIGLPTIASDVGPYRGLDQYGAVLTENSVEAWRTAIRELVDNPVTAREHLEQSADYLVRERTFSSGIGMTVWLRQLLGG